MMLRYPVTLSPNRAGGFIATFPDVPEAVTEAESRAEALRWAADALHVALTGYVEDGRPLPRPSRSLKGQKLIELPPMTAAKLAVYQAMHEANLSQIALADRLRCDPRQVRRLLDLDHRSRLDQIEAALTALGKRLVIEVRNAA